MKKASVVLLSLACVAAVSFASLRTNKTIKKEVKTEKNQKEVKKECKRTCLFSFSS